ncbi:MAG TPA: Hsp20/alpha crystallin family protein [Acholeplasmataceae bacterium]|jgi:HSP20 family protein|nr:Hsp20/alpha crystallin family protein [Acholeplasmataceae bacterium]
MYKITRRSPFRVFDEMFDDFFKDSTRTTYLATDLKESDNDYTLLVDVPGVDKENLRLTLDNGYLTIEVSQTDEVKDENERYLRQERRSVNVKRSYYVGETFTEEDINASLESGVLTLKFPKEGTKQEVTKYIEIK